MLTVHPSLSLISAPRVPLALACAAVLGLAACAPMQVPAFEPEPARESLARQLVEEPAAPKAKAAQIVEASSSAARPLEASVTLRPAIAQDEKADLGEIARLFQTAAFQRRFIESFLSETDIEPTVNEDERETMTKVLDLIGADKPMEAADVLESARGESTSAVLDFTVGNIYYQTDDLVRAEGAYLDAVAKFPNFRRAWKNLAQIHFRQGHFKASVGAFSKVLQLGGGDGITYGLMGVAHARMSSPIAAESAFRLAMMHDPDTIDWKLGLAESFFKQRRYADAVTLFDKLIELKPERAQLWLAQGEAFARMGKPMKAAENFEVVDQLGASTAGSLFNLADIYANEKLYDLATSAYVRALEKDPTAKVDRVIRAAKFLSMSNAMDEMEALVDGIERARADSLSKDEKKELLKLRARLAVSRGAGEQEAAVLLEIVKLDPLDGDALILLGQHSARGGDVERAILYYEQAASIEKFEADAKVRHAQLLVRERRYDEALPLLRRAQTIKPRENIARYLEQVERVAKANRGR